MVDRQRPQILERQKDRAGVQEPWFTWGLRLLKACQSAASNGEIDQWINNNRLIMEVMQEEVPEDHARLTRAIDMARIRHRGR